MASLASSSLPTANPLVAPFETTAGKQVRMAQHAGFCHGVKKAVNRAEQSQQLVSPSTPTYVLGQLIHNQQEIERLSALGIHTVQDLSQVPDGSVCVIRTHGAPPEVIRQAEARGITMVDATCPDVRLVQNKAVELVQEGYTVVIVGKENHPEVIGISAFAREVPGAHVVAIHSPADIEERLRNLPKRRIGVVSQTTQLEESFFDMVKLLAMQAKELKVFNTICPATFYRQHAAFELASQVQVMVVVGGKNSSNTTHLADICQELGTPVRHIETPDELADWPELAAANSIGVTAGASTPDWIVQDVLQYLKQHY